MDRSRSAHAVAEEFITAIAAGDSVAIAALMSTRALDELLSAARRWDSTIATAQQAAARVWRGPNAVTKLFGELRIDTVVLAGDRATVTYSHPTYGRDPEDDFFVLADVDGRWVVDAFADDPYDDDLPPWAFAS